MDESRKGLTYSVTVPTNVVYVNHSNLPLYWDGVRWSTFNPDTKITIVPAKEDK